ncbi:uncharacterized protein [Nicotiana tomentosiformis]|uniref:uncharacterized protein n=1 Tax=Nicotiana tomentosiformis TaxID=4098 RepID=UPI00051AC525|nr:uncharacterized protein LOC104103060 [Nicotiana tomentosiformis]
MGSPITYTKVQDFADCMTSLSLNELSWTGEYYTWSNKQYGADRVCSRLDRELGNFEWIMQWGHVTTDYGLPFISDHNPMILTLHSTPKYEKVPFRFFNVWVEHDSFIDIVERIWGQSYIACKMKNSWMKLKALRPIFRALNNEQFRTISLKNEQARVELENIQRKINAACNDSLIGEERNLLQNLEKWSLIEECILKQKSRAKWIRLGDSNTEYFAAVMKERSQKTQLNKIMALTCDKLTHLDSIKQEVIEFYKSLMGSAAHYLPAINRLIMRNGPILSQQKKIALCVEVTDKEIYA